MMTRVKNSVPRRQRYKKTLKQCKGFSGRAKSCFNIGNRLLRRAYNYQFADRKKHKSNKRREFIGIINAYCRDNNTKYSIFINKFNKHKISKIVDRKAFALVIQNDVEQANKIFKIINQ